MIYLIDWYWNWIEFRLDRQLTNIVDSREKLRIVIKLLTQEKVNDSQFAFVDEHLLQKMVIKEFEKTYLTKHVDADNKEGLFLPYKVVCQKITDIIKELNPDYAFPKSLVSTVLLTVNHQLYYAKHLPSLSDIKNESSDKHEELFLFIDSLISNAIGVTNNA